MCISDNQKTNVYPGSLAQMVAASSRGLMTQRREEKSTAMDSMELKGALRPRPIRVVFLLQQGEQSDLILDAIFADCYSRWGGRFSLLVPCVNDSVPPQYWLWLEQYDPDIVYSYVELPPLAVAEIHERLNPAEYVRHRKGGEPAQRVADFRPRFDFGQPLQSLSTIFRAARRRSPFDRNPSDLKLIECWYEQPSRFFLDNVSSPFQARGNSFYPRDAAAEMGLIHIVSPEKLTDRQSGVPRDLETIASELDALRGLAQGRFVALALLAASYAPRLELRFHPWAGSFNLVVGDTFADRVLFWNARHLNASWLDSDLCCFRVTLEQLHDPGFRKTLVELLNNRNKVNAGSGGQSALTLRSTSCGQAELESVSRLLREEKLWSIQSVHRVASLDEVIPDRKALEGAMEASGRGDTLDRRPDWEPFVWTPPVARPPHVRPDHLEDVPHSHHFGAGLFAVDHDLEISDPDASVYWSDRRPRWVLPRRWRLAEAFQVSRGESQRVLPQRGTRQGFLTLLGGDNLRVGSIKVPSTSDAIRYALVHDGLGRNGTTGYPRPKVAWIEPSNEARYLIGVLGLVDGLAGATSFLLHPFLREMFANLGGSTKIAAEAVEPSINRIRKAARSKANFNLRDPQDVGAVADLVVLAARSLKSSSNYVGYEDLVRRWDVYLRQYWERNHKPESNGAEADFFDARERQSLDHCLTEMRKRKILFQGHRWLCSKCHNQNWSDLSQLAPLQTCTVCGNVEDAPISPHWLFRPNQFLIDALRDHSALSLIWALAKVAERSRRSFIFVGPRWYGYEHDSSPDEVPSPDAETDLIMLLDGRVIVCEVKATWRQLKSADLPELVSLAKRLRPDVVLLAVMEEASGPSDRLEEARSELNAASIDFQIMTLNSRDHRYDSSFLL